MDYLETTESSLKSLSVIPLFLTTIAIAHTQEALFAGILISGLLFWRTCRTYFRRSRIPPLLHRRHRVVSIVFISIVVCLIVLVAGYRNIGPWGYTPHVVSLGLLFPFLEGVPVANPSFRFWDTVGVFGVLTYICYFLYWKKFRDLDYINFGMISPLVTHFNPLFAILFLHFGTSTTLWRTSYLVPLAMTSALIIVFSFIQYRQSHTKLKRFVSTFPPLLFCVSILPFQTGDSPNRTSRIPSLLPVEHRSGAHLWMDLILETSKITRNGEIRGILTDNVTKFVLDSAVFNMIPQRNSLEYFPAQNLTYQMDLIHSDFTNHLLIINRRDGEVTASAKYSGHWPTNILKTSLLYPNDIDEFIEENPSRFELRWSDNSIYIYEIVSF